MSDMDTPITRITRKELYSTVFTQQFSPCGNYLVAGNNYGKIAVYHITPSLTVNSTMNNKLPVNVFQAQTGCIYCFASTEQYLICGGSLEVSGYLWKEVLHHKDPKPKWTFRPQQANPFDFPETNGLVVNKQDDSLIAGCGDNNIYIWDMCSGDVKCILKGHKDYIHCVDHLRKTNQVMSGSEDGTVKFWDVRTSEAVEQITPSSMEMACRNSLGKWISCVAVDSKEDWMVCGGAPHCTIWHLRSKTMTAMLPTSNSCQQVAKFEDDFILTAGTEPNVFKWSINGELRGKFPCTPSSVFSLEINKNLNKILAISGSSFKIDISTNFDYKAFSLQFRE